MTYSLGEAARATGLSKSTILRAIRGNKISAARNERNQGWIIEPSELHRLYPAVANDAPVNTETTRHETQETVMGLRLRLEAATQRLADQEAVIADLREDRDQWRNQAQRLAIQDQRAKAPDVIAMPSASPPHVSLVQTPTDAPAAAEPAPAADNQPQQYPARAVVKKAQKRTPKADVGWWRKMIGGR